MWVNFTMELILPVLVIRPFFRFGSTEALGSAGTRMFSVYFLIVLNCHEIVQWELVPKLKARDSKRSVIIIIIINLTSSYRMFGIKINELCMRWPREADRRLCRPMAELTGWHSSIRYSGATPTRQCRTRRTILNSVRFPIGSQCSSSRMAPRFC